MDKGYHIKLRVTNEFFDEGVVLMSLKDGKITGEGLLTCDYLRIEEQGNLINFLIFERDIFSNVEEYFPGLSITFGKCDMEIPCCLYFIKNDLKIIIDDKLTPQEVVEFRKELEAVKAEGIFFEPE